MFKPICLIIIAMITVFVTEANAQRLIAVTGATESYQSQIKQLTVQCPEGYKAVGAGWSVSDSTNSILEGEATHSMPSFDLNSWTVNAKNNSEYEPVWKLNLRVVCSYIK